jgi:voltage-gated potassium channel
MSVEDPSSSRGWWPIAAAALRAVLTASVLVALYYLLPLDRPSGTWAILELVGGASVFVGLTTWHIWAIAHSKHPTVRALEGLFVAVPLFILLFASA